MPKFLNVLMAALRSTAKSATEYQRAAVVTRRRFRTGRRDYDGPGRPAGGRKIIQHLHVARGKAFGKCLGV